MASTLTQLSCNATILLLLCCGYKFEYCHLKALNRSTREVSIKLNLYDKPVRQVNISMQFLKKSNGYRQFMPDLNLDACLYLKKQNNFILNSLYKKLWSHYSNMNHTCPFDHDLIVSKLQVLDVSVLAWIPFPMGDYAIYTTWYIKNVQRFQLDTFFSFLEI